jgi:predicted ATP-grasp superfamily ATP-dependent carboligase
VAYKNDVLIDENAVAREILSQYLVGREGNAMLSVWMEQFEKAIKQ